MEQEVNMKKIRLGIIGAGFAWERLHYPALEKLKDQFEIVAMSSLNRTDTENFAKKIDLDFKNVYPNYQEMLQRDDLDAVDIVVPIEQNYEVSEQVAKAGKNFMCEKPLAQNMAEAQKYLQLKRKYGVQILIAENFRYDEEHNRIREIIGKGKIGEVVYFTLNNIFSFPQEMLKDTYAAKEWRQHPKYYGGAFLDGAVHDIAAIRHIFGEVESVQAFGKPQSADFSPFVSINTNILFKSGVIGQYTYFPSGVEAQKPRSGFRIYGTHGSIYLEDKHCGVINVFYNDQSIERVGFTPGQGFYNEFMNFYQSLNGNEEISVTPEVEYGDAKMIFDILRSVNNHEIVRVDGIDMSQYPAGEAYGDVFRYLQ
jgi:predicted dehydrogenase